MRTFLTVLILLFIFSSCGTDSPDNPLVSEKVEINVIGLPRILEKSTELSIVVQSASNTITTVYIDNQEAISSNDKNFTFTLDPFNHIIGDKTLKVISVDEENNQSEVSYSFQLRKLLFTLNYLFTQSDYVAIHTLDGELVTYEKYEGQSMTFYAGDDFERQNFIVSAYQFNSFDTRTYIRSYSDLEPGSANLSFEEQEEEFQGLRLGITDKIKLRVSSIGSNLIGGYNGIVQADTGNLVYFPISDGEYDFLYNTDLQEDFYLFSVYEGEPTFKNKYLTAKINDLSENSYTEEDFSPIENHKEVSVSLDNTHSFSYTVEGYRNLEDYYNYKFHLVNSDYLSLQTNSKVRIPLLDEFSLYQVKFSTLLGNNSSVRVNQHLSIDENEIRIPSMNLTKTDNSFLFTGEREYDYSVLTYSDYTENEIGDYSDFVWSFYQGFKEKIGLSIFNFEHPKEVLESMNSISLNPFDVVDEGKSLHCSLSDHEDEVTFENLVFSQGYSSNEKGYQYVFNFENLLE